MTTTTRRGRPSLAWISAADTAALPPGTAVAVETHGRHAARTVGRVTGALEGNLDLATARGEVRLPLRQIKRARLVGGLYEPGDPVLLRGTDAALWRGGVVRTSGTDVLVEQIGGEFAWHHEGDLEPPDARDEPLPALPRGPVPVRAG